MANPQVTLTGILRDISGATNAGTLTFTLCNFGDTPPMVAGGAIVADVVTKTQSAPDGTFSMQLWGNDQLTPTGTYYQIQVNGADGSTVMVAAYLLNSGTYDLSTLQPIDTSSGTPLVYVPLLLSMLPAFTNNAAAKAGGVAIGGFYRTGGDPDLVCQVH